MKKFPRYNPKTVTDFMQLVREGDRLFSDRTIYIYLEQKQE